MKKTVAKNPAVDETVQKPAKNFYNPSAIEPKWQAVWQKEKTYQPDLETANRPFYNLMMFPYPSAEGLHVGSMYTFSGVDVYGRFKRMQGYDVFEPIGLDGFGIHSENHAIKTGTHPMEHAKTTEKTFYRQLREIGNGFAWDNKLKTYDPNYYKWTQWLFTELFKMGLAYRKKAPVNFCPSCKTVLADEQVVAKSKMKDERSKISENQRLDQRKSEKELDEVTIKVCERCGTEIEMKNLEQWFFRITDYADRLLANIDNLNWTEKIKTAQREWIGKSDGARIEFKDQNAKFKIEVFTTAIDTIYGVTFMVISPEHPLVQQILKQTQDENISKSVRDYVDKAKNKSEIERVGEGKEKTGVFSGANVINPFNNEQVPVWIADYVLMGYGTGAVMGVPGHDARDHEFAKKFGLPVKPVVKPKSSLKEAKVEEDGFWDYIEVKTKFADKSELFDSEEFSGLTSTQAKAKMLEFIKKEGFGDKTTTYHLRDWLISRQRYWGPPIPMIYCKSCAEKGLSWFTTGEAKKQQVLSSMYHVSSRNDKTGSAEAIHNTKYIIRNTENAGWYPEENLPVELPYIKDFKPLGTGKAPLANHPEFYEVKCPECGVAARRETDVSDTFLDSSWYFLRYLATDRDDIPFPSKAFISEHSTSQNTRKTQNFSNSDNRSGQKFGISDASDMSGSPSFSESSGIENRLKFLPVTMYIGGAEHAVMHLLYARFMTMAIHDMGLISFEEPFTRFYAHGLIIKDGAKMSKSKGNVVNPDVYIKKYGADTLRTYLRFLGPFDQTGDFRDSGVEGMNRFLKKIWRLFSEAPISNFKFQISNDRLRMLHHTVKLVTGEMEELRFNTSIAHLMSYYNFLSKQESVSQEEVEVYLKLLAPFAPHMTEELFSMIHTDTQQIDTDKDPRKSAGNQWKSIHLSAWPAYDEKYLVSDTAKIPVQVNGKFRGMIEVASSDIEDKAKIEQMARNDEKVASFLVDKKVLKLIYIEGKVVNFVIEK